jgi:hypothetical protein
VPPAGDDFLGAGGGGEWRGCRGGRRPREIDEDDGRIFLVLVFAKKLGMMERVECGVEDLPGERESPWC